LRAGNISAGKGGNPAQKLSENPTVTDGLVTLPALFPFKISFSDSHRWTSIKMLTLVG